MKNAKKIKFSIIIPTYNRAWCIERAINSVLKQDFQNWEIIIVDDGSSDNTNELVEKYLTDNRIRYFYKENGGVGSARNKGIKESVGEWIIFLDSDDEFTINTLNIIQKYISKFTNSFFLLFGVIDENGKNMYFMENKINKIDFRDYIEGKKISGELLNCIKREVFLGMDDFKFPENVNGGEGLLWFRLIKKYPAISINEILRIYHKDANDSLVRQKLDKKRAYNIYRVNRLIIDNFNDDLIKYNKKYLSKNYFVVANMLALMGKIRKSMDFFYQGVEIKNPSVKDFILYIISVLDINFFLYNFLNKFKKD